MGDSAEDTEPSSLSGMRKAIERSNANSAAALEWSVKTYHLVAPVANRMATAQRESRWAMLAAALAVFASFLGLACR